MKALVVGGTGPTGPHLVQGLLDRGYEVAVFHRGVHEIEELPPVEHIHGDPHFRETIAEALAGREFDVVLAVYGRVRYLAEVLTGRCRQFIGVGGVAAHRGFLQPEALHPYGMRVPTRESDDQAIDSDGSEAGRFSNLIYSTEEMVFSLADQGAFEASYFRYPLIYGPRQLRPGEWSVVRRVLDGRPHIIVPDGGLAILPRCAAPNAAHAVLLAVDRADAAAGQVYNVTDEEQLTLRQWIELVAEYAGGRLDLVSVPDYLAKAARALFPMMGPSSHGYLDITKLKTDLGYREVVSIRAALKEAVEWLLEHPVTPEEYPNFRDRFDYAYEDRFIDDYRQALAGLEAAHPYDAGTAVHSYAHPKVAGAGRDHRGR